AARVDQQSQREAIDVALLVEFTDLHVGEIRVPQNVEFDGLEVSAVDDVGYARGAIRLGDGKVVNEIRIKRDGADEAVVVRDVGRDHVQRTGGEAALRVVGRPFNRDRIAVPVGDDALHEVNLVELERGVVRIRGIGSGELDVVDVDDVCIQRQVIVVV